LYLRNIKYLMSNSCNQTSTLSNTAEIVENESRFKLTPLLLNKERFLGLSKITKE